MNSRYIINHARPIKAVAIAGGLDFFLVLTMIAWSVGTAFVFIGL